MGHYVMHEATFDVPSEWRDNSVNIFMVVGKGPPADLSFVISRDLLQPGTELVDYVEKQLGDVGKKLRKFRIIGKRQIEVGGRSALEAEFTWVSEQCAMHQIQQYVRLDQKVIVFTASAPVKIADEHQEQIKTLLASIQFNS